ncbi:MAG TPA: serine hydrolase domain-containing protein [Phycisphaerales bacterium]|nr:serine hydrolase domain-containing protein [Phycisphaerales bacterium]
MPLRERFGSLHILFACSALVMTPCASPCFRCAAQELPAADVPVASRLEAAITKAAAGPMWGAVLVMRGGDVLLERGFGDRTPDRPAPIDAVSLFDVGSISKQFTAAAVLLLEQEGRLGLDDPVERYLPEAKGSGVTVRHLLTHRGGLNDEQGMSALGEPSRGRMLRRAFAAKPKFTPGEAFVYSNLGYCVLAAVVDEASGVGFDVFLRERVFKGAGLASTGFTDGIGLDSTRVTHREQTVAGAPGGTFDDPWGWGARGCTSVVTNLEDLRAWCGVLRTSKLLGEGRRATMFAPGEADRRGRGRVAMGWFIERGIGGRERIGHGGATRGYRAVLSVIPSEGVTIAVLTNLRQNPIAIRDAVECALFPEDTPASAAWLRTGDLPLNEHGVALAEDAALAWSHAADPETSVVPIAPEAAPWAGTLALRVDDSAQPVAVVWLTRGAAQELRARLADVRAPREQGRGAGSTLSVAISLYEPAGAEPALISGESVRVELRDRYVGMGEHGRFEDVRPTLVVIDAEKGVWPLIVRMDDAAAESLADALDKLTTR